MAMVFTNTLMELATWAFGKTMSNTEGARKPGQMARTLKETMLTERSMVREPITGPTALASVGDGAITKSTASVFTNGQTADGLKETGRTTTCTERACTPGLTVEGTKETMKMTRSTATAFTSGLMVASTTASGWSASSTDKAPINTQMEQCVKESGLMENELCGSISEKIQINQNSL